MHSGYQQQFAKLNNAQKNAVKAIDGPLLVVAGPGTGKTQLLSMRVANILKNTDTNPGSILCLTFTNKAATNMKDRLLDLTGGQARKVTTKTFHGFAAEIMNMYPEYFWNNARLVVAPDAAVLEIIQTILSGLPLDNPLAMKFAGKFTAISDIQNSLKLVKEAGLTPSKLRALIETNMAYIDQIEKELTDILAPLLSVKKLGKLRSEINNLSDQPIDAKVFPLLSLSTVIKESLDLAIEKDADTGKTKKVGIWKKRWIQVVDGNSGMFDERRRNMWWLALADVYEQYRQYLHTRGYYDYADMLVEVISQLETHPELRSSVQERFLYVLIDEFQDTNPAQLRLAHLVADHHSAGGKPNLMAVGDDDQSIYKFNGAELNNMLSFRRMYINSKLIVLKENYRSTQKVLDAAARIINQADDRLVNRSSDITKNLIAVNSPKEQGRIAHMVYPTREHQIYAVADLIKQTYSQKVSTAVLARGHESLKQMAGMLIRLNVPVHYEQQSNVLEHEAVKQATLIAKLVVAISEGNDPLVNESASQLLTYPMWSIPPEKLWKLAAFNFSHEQWLGSILKHEDGNISGVGKWLLWLASEAKYQHLTVVMEYILGLRESKLYTSPLRDYYSKKREGSDYLHALSAIQLLRTLVNEFSMSNQPTLSDFTSFVDLYDSNSKIIADESPFVTQKNAVQLSTVHKAKGLEFDRVFIIDAVDKNWQPRIGGRKPPANLPLQPHGDDEDDYVRLMYVAATRAKHTLLVASYAQDHAGEEVLATPIVRSAINDTENVTVQDIKHTIHVLEENLKWPRLEAKDELMILQARLDTYNLSVTHLLNFLDLSRGGPQYFLQRNLLRLPEAKTANLAHGTAMHSALETAQHLTNIGQFNLKKVKADYIKALKEEGLPSSETARYAKQGPLILGRLFKELGYKMSKGSLPEQNINNISLGKATISGKLDRVDFMGNDSLMIVDYKTGRTVRSFATKDRSQALRSWKHKTQLIFYALLALNSPRFDDKQHIEGQMVYVEVESPKELLRTYTPSKEEIDRLSTLINAVWSKIMKLDLPAASRYTPDIDGIKQFEEDLIAKKI